MPWTFLVSLVLILFRYEDQSFWSPTRRVLLRWYYASLLASGLSFAGWIALKKRFASRWLLFAWTVIVGVVGTPVLTGIFGVFTFTGPLVLFIAFAGALLPVVNARSTNHIASPVRARLVLVILFAFYGGYYWICREFFFVAGWGFLVGFLPALPTTLKLGRWILERAPEWRIQWMGFLSFTLYYWASALFIGWRTS